MSGETKCLQMVYAVQGLLRSSAANSPDISVLQNIERAEMRYGSQASLASEAQVVAPHRAVAGSGTASHCAGGGGSGVRLGEGAVVTTAADTDLGEPAAESCWSCRAGTVWIRTWGRQGTSTSPTNYYTRCHGPGVSPPHHKVRKCSCILNVTFPTTEFSLFGCWVSIE